MAAENPDVGILTLHGQQLCIPDLRPAFGSWRQGVNPLHERVKQAVDARLEGLIADGRVLAKVKAADIGLFASGCFPDASYHVLETVAFYCVWLFLWDDAIDGATANPEGLVAEHYCRQSVAFVKHHLVLGDEIGAPEPQAPTPVSASFAEVGRRVSEYGKQEDMRALFSHLKEYMEACVTEYEWRLSRKVPSVEDFYSWRLGTSSVDVMLDLLRILNDISLPAEILVAPELAAMGLDVNKLLIMINELFSLKKELKDGAFGNLIPITMRSSGLDLGGAVKRTVEDVYDCIEDFEASAAALRQKAVTGHGPEAALQLERLIEAYQAVATSVLHFSIHSPRYGLLRDGQEDGSFVVML